MLGYASLVLHDEGQEITEAALNKVLEASKNKVSATTVKLFAAAMASTKVGDLLENAAAAAPAGGAAPAGDAAAATAEAPKEEKKEEVEDVNMGGLFGDDDDY